MFANTSALLKKFTVIALFCFFAGESKAEIQIELGPTNISGDWVGGALVLSERFGKYDFGIGYVSEQDINVTCGPPLLKSDKCNFDIRENIFVHAQRIFRFKWCEFGIGPSYWQNTSRILGKNFNFSLMLGCAISEKSFIRIRHVSNAGSGTPNLGQDLLTVGWRF